MNRQDFVTKVNTKHNNLYNYFNLPDNIMSKDNITLVCRIHGKVKVQASNHIQGRGCKKCGNSRRLDRPQQTKCLTFEQYKVKANSKHKNAYTYISSTYKSTKEKLTIVCAEHGEFTQLASNHLSGKGCPYCGNRWKGDSREATLYYFNIQDKFKIGITRNSFSRRYLAYERAKMSDIHTWILDSDTAQSIEQQMLAKYKDVRCTTSELNSGNTEFLYVDILDDIEKEVAKWV